MLINFARRLHTSFNIVLFIKLVYIYEKDPFSKEYALSFSFLFKELFLFFFNTIRRTFEKQNEHRERVTMEKGSV